MSEKFSPPAIAQTIKMPSKKPKSPRRLVINAFLAASAADGRSNQDRKSTRLNSSHSQISYAVFCLKKKKQTPNSRLITLLRPCYLTASTHLRAPSPSSLSIPALVPGTVHPPESPCTFSK